MKTLTLISILFMLVSQAGCTTGKGLGEKEEIWYNNQVSFFGIFTSSDVYYCKSNKEPSGLVKPKCYEAVKLSAPPQ